MVFVSGVTSEAVLIQVGYYSQTRSYGSTCGKPYAAFDIYVAPVPTSPPALISGETEAIPATLQS